MLAKPIPTGVDDFGKLVENNYYFVDKSLFIKALLDKRGEVNLFTLPRRFGKTLNMSMLQSLKSARTEDFEQAFAAMKDEIAEEFGRHAFVLESEALTPHMKERYRALMEGTAQRTEYNRALKFLSECLHRCYGQKVILLVDEYDVPLESAWLNQYDTRMVSFVRLLFESAFKTNPHMEFAVVTGCLRISKESIFTGLNNFDIDSVMSRNYDTFFGFTDAEVQKLCQDYGLSGKYDLIRQWYNGYVFGNQNVYNPWSVNQYVKDLLANRDEFPSCYWANTSSNSIVRKLVDCADQETKLEIEQLIEGKTVEKPVREDITYEDIYKTMDNLWNFMLYTGYFRKERERFDAASGQRYVSLAIPNEEVRYIFRNKVSGWFREQIEERDRTQFFSAIVSLDRDTVQREIEDMLRRTISFYDAFESFYHGFLAGILYGMEGYVVKSNRESGGGRTDLFVKPVSRKKAAFVFDFKVADKIEKLGQEALWQIQEKRYESELQQEGYLSVVRYGIAFCGKDCEVVLQSGE